MISGLILQSRKNQEKSIGFYNCYPIRAFGLCLAEIVGITEGVQWTFALTNKFINLQVDSKAAIKTIRSSHTKSHCVRLYKQAITRLSVAN